jgi:DNA mismatch repair protein MutS2
MDLVTDTLEGLDWPRVLEALAAHTGTMAGARAARAISRLSLPEVHASHDAMSELRTLADADRTIHVAGVHDIAEDVAITAKGGVLDVPELRAIGDTLLAMEDLGEQLLEAGDLSPVLGRLGAPLPVGLDLTAELRDAFDRTGQLSGERYPELAELRRRIADLHGAIRGTLEELVKGDSLADMLQDRFVTQRADRYVLPLKAFAKGHDVGIVQGVSGSGQTVFVEPHQVVQLNNRLRIAEGELLAAERRILAQLSRWVASEAASIADGLEAATAIDLILARERLARELDCTRPRVSQEGVIRVTGARHAVLALRGVPVVPNDLALSAAQPALVLTGPNAGGKTVALKTLALCALLVSVGCWVPADEGSRVDLFDGLLASIGDAQSVAEDLSSFSGHLTVLREMLGAAGPGQLLLLDELAVGTDPAQGAALAQAVLERLVDRGARVVVTTHFARLKSMAVVDDRFAAAAVEHVHGEPTYRVVQGATGESHALSIARRMDLDEALLARTEALLGEGERAFSMATEALEVERAQLARARVEAESRAAELERRALALAERGARIRARAAQLEEQAAQSFRDRLARADEAIGQVVAELQKQPSHAGVRHAKATVEALGALAPEPIAPEPAADESAGTTLAVGDQVRLKTGQLGEVVQLRGSRVEVRAGGGLTVRVRRDEVLRIGGAVRAPRPQSAAPKMTRPSRAIPLDQAVRVDANTLDLRGKRVDEGLSELDMFLDRAQRASWDSAFVLHGHGTGAMKRAVREFLRTSAAVARWMPANADQGGDAYTVVALP